MLPAVASQLQPAFPLGCNCPLLHPDTQGPDSQYSSASPKFQQASHSHSPSDVQMHPLKKSRQKLSLPSDLCNVRLQLHSLQADLHAFYLSPLLLDASQHQPRGTVVIW